MKEENKKVTEKGGPGWSEIIKNARILPAIPKCAHARIETVTDIANLKRFEKDERGAFARQKNTHKKRNRKKKRIKTEKKKQKKKKVKLTQ